MYVWLRFPDPYTYIYIYNYIFTIYIHTGWEPSQAAKNKLHEEYTR